MRTVREDVFGEACPKEARLPPHRGETVRVRMVRQKIRIKIEFDGSRADTYRRKSVPVPHVQGGVYKKMGFGGSRASPYFGETVLVQGVRDEIRQKEDSQKPRTNP